MLLVINIERIRGGVVTFKGNIMNKFTGLGVVSGNVYIINRAKGKGGVEM